MTSLYEAVLRESGISPLFAAGVIARACLRAGIRQPEELTATQLKKAITQIERSLRVYLPTHEVPLRIAALKALI